MVFIAHTKKNMQNLLQTYFTKLAIIFQDKQKTKRV